MDLHTLAITTSDVLFVPSASRNLLSVGKFCEEGDLDKAVFDKDGCKLYKNGRVIATAIKVNGLYEL